MFKFIDKQQKTKNLLLIVIFIIIGSWLITDATTFSLYPADPIKGRIHACFTDVEIWLGHLEPSSWIRLAEFGLGIIMFISAISIGFTTLWKIFRRNELNKLTK